MPWRLLRPCSGNASFSAELARVLGGTEVSSALQGRSFLGRRDAGREAMRRAGKTN